MKMLKFFAPAVLTAAIIMAGTFLSSCLNPVGFPIDINANVSGEIDVNIKPGDEDKPGTISEVDDPNTHPGADVGVIVFKNLTGGEKAVIATFRVVGTDIRQNVVDVSLSLNAGGERSLVLYPSDMAAPYDIHITYEGGEFFLNKALLRGRVEYVYFYFGRDGQYHGTGDSNEVYINIDLTYTQDNENDGHNRDNDSVTKPEEGDVSVDNDPRTKLPAAMRENYGLVYVHNLSHTKDLMKAVFDHYATTGPATFDAHWEMNPGPSTGSVKSIILRTGDWQTRGLWVDPADPGCAGGLIAHFTVLKASLGISHVYFYKGTDGKWYLTDNPDPSAWNPPLDETDYDSGGAGNGGGGSAGGSTASGEGQTTSENGNISTGGTWWDNNRDHYGILTVKNLTSQARITKVDFTAGTFSGAFTAASPIKKYTMGPVQPGNDRSIILGGGVWKIDVSYTVTVNGVAQNGTLTGYKSVRPLGITGYINYVYFYYGKDGSNPPEYMLKPGMDPTNEDPPDNQVPDGAGGGTGPGAVGEREGDSPGAITDNNRNLGLLVTRNLTKGVSAMPVDQVVFEKTDGTKIYAMKAYSDPPANTIRAFTILAGEERSILLSPGDWRITLYYTYPATGQPEDGVGPNGKTITKTKTVKSSLLGVNYVYFYRTTSGSYDLGISDGLPPDYDPNENGPVTNPLLGSITIKNNSLKGTVIREIRWTPGGVALVQEKSATVFPSGSYVVTDLNPDAGGNGKIQFKINDSTIFGQEVNAHVYMGQTTEVIYTDDIENLIPVGFGVLRLQNNSAESVTGITTYDRAMIPHEYNITVLSNGGVASLNIPNGSYIVQVHLESYNVERILEFLNNIVPFTITANEHTGVGNPDPDSRPGKGSVRLYNSYYESTSQAALDFKVFKFIMTGVDDRVGYASPTKGLVYVWNGTGIGSGRTGNSAATPAGSRAVPGQYFPRTSTPNPPTQASQIPAWHASATGHWGGNDYTLSTYQPITRSDNDNLSGLEPGYYRLTVVAGSYSWQMYVDGLAVTGVAGHGPAGVLIEEDITYDCGEIAITEGNERQYYFDARNREKDTPNGYVTVYIQFTGSEAFGTEYHPAAFEEISYPPSVADTKFATWPKAWKNFQEGPYAESARTIIRHTRILNSNNATAGPFAIPPGYYFGRYGDTHGTNGRVRGNGTANWRAMDLRLYYRRTITISLDPTSGFTWMESGGYH
jgi:hypothetical protein